MSAKTESFLAAEHAKICETSDSDRALADRGHELIVTTAPGLPPGPEAECPHTPVWAAISPASFTARKTSPAGTQPRASAIPQNWITEKVLPTWNAITTVMRGVERQIYRHRGASCGGARMTNLEGSSPRSTGRPGVL